MEASLMKWTMDTLIEWVQDQEEEEEVIKLVLLLEEVEEEASITTLKIIIVEEKEWSEVEQEECSRISLKTEDMFLITAETEVECQEECTEELQIWIDTKCMSHLVKEE